MDFRDHHHINNDNDIHDVTFSSSRFMPTMSVHELLAIRVANQRLFSYIHKIFVAWRNYVFTLFYMRHDMVVYHHYRRVVVPIFNAWYKFTRRHARVGILLRRHWRRKRKHAFQIWKFSMKYQRHKEYHYDKVLAIFYNNLQYGRHIAKKWIYLMQGLYVVKIQHAFKCYRYRKIFWAMKTIKRTIMTCNGFRLLRIRKIYDHKRKIAEDETVSILNRRSQTCIDDFFSQDNDHAQVMIEKYLHDVHDALEEIENAPKKSTLKRTKMFPSSKERNELSMCWTVRSKAISILKIRCHDIVSFSARKRFRQTYPPRYECYRCYQVFTLRKEVYDHCKYRCPIIHDYNTDTGHHDPSGNNNSNGYNVKRFLREQELKQHNTHLFDIGAFKFFGGLLLPTKEERRKCYESRIYSRHLSARNKYIYDLQKPDYYCAKLAQHIVDTILHPIAPFLTTAP